jgi:N-acetyl-anhydromuramyl-L-alanine amidase AmpD
LPEPGRIAEPTVTWKGAHKSNYATGRNDYAPEAVVLHIADGSIDGMDTWFSNPASGVSSHYGIAKTGRIHQYVNVADTAYTNGIIEAAPLIVRENPGANPNNLTVTIEFEGLGGQQPTAEQHAAGAHLIAWLFQSVLLTGGASGVVLDRDHVLMHRDISPRSKPGCPGWGEGVQERFIKDATWMLAPKPDPDPLFDFAGLRSALATLRSSLDSVYHQLDAVIGRLPKE